MANRVSIIVTILAAMIIFGTSEVIEPKCPDDCHCHYFRINWVTDCSESNLTSIPYPELSPDVYILDMNGNNVVSLAPFPPEIKLRRLQMAHNRLTELKSESFAGLTYLLDADFSSNAIARVDPETFRDSPGFITLELQNNPLSEVTGQFLNCRTLLYLDLSNCNINHLNDHFFHNTTNLNKLDLSKNPLERIEPGPFDHLTNLEHLKLSACDLAHVSPLAFVNLENLRELEMNDNQLATISWTSILTPLVRLEELNIANTGIKNLPGDAFARNNYLRELSLARNELRHLDVGNTLGHNLHNLQSLDLSYCNLQDRLTEVAFRNASKLRSLNLSGNPMFASDLKVVLRHLPKLHKLSLSNCSLRRLPDTFEIFENLEELDVSHNPLNDAFVGLLSPLRSLKYLDMSYCKLGYVGNETFAQMTELRRLILSGNKLHKLEDGLFENLTRLASLELKNCDLRTPVDPMIFGKRNFTNVIELKISDNPIVLPKHGSLMPKQLAGLEILDLSNCNLTSLSENIFLSSRNLTQLNLSGNELSGVENLSFLKNLRKLEHLDLSNNRLVTVGPKILRHNRGLLSINLIGNPIVCNCSIVDMWNWASKVRNDLNILVGSRTSDFATGGAKLRKSLLCFYDNETYAKIVNQGRKGNQTPSRTWAKYIREANCPPSS